MTPCEEKGYKVGDEFVVTKDTTFPKGARVRLYEDDRTNSPVFKGIGCKAVDGEDWHYIGLGRVRKVGNDDSIITRTNGQPYATEASARQQLTAKGLQDTHEVVPHEGGYALAPKQDVPNHKFKAGDKVRVNGYMEDGNEHKYGTSSSIRMWMRKNKTISVVESDSERVEAGDEDISLSFHPSELDLVESNATPQTEETTMTTNPITALKQARQARDEAEQAYQKALEEAREYLGEGFELTEVGTDGPLVDGEDMTDPANWREGDVVECIDDKPKYCHKGGLYIVNDNHLRYGDGKIRIKADDDGDEGVPRTSSFRFHHRPA